MKFISIGSNCIDLYEDKIFVGGGPINVCVNLRDFNYPSTYLGAVGNDKYGELILKTLKEKDIDISHIKVLEGSSAISYVEIQNNERIFVDYKEGVLESFRLNDEDIKYIKEFDYLFCDYFSKQEEYLKELKKDINIIYDCADKDPLEFKYLEDIDYLFFSSNEINKGKLKEIYSKGLKLVVNMLGSKGSICFDGNKYYYHDIIKNDNIVDTMGAGDAYISGFIYGLLNNKDINECMYLGSKKASETLSFFGAFK